MAPWKAPGAPGKFQLQVGGEVVAHTFGTKGEAWHWEYGGTVAVNAAQTELRLKDLTGFDGRCDALFFSTTRAAPQKVESRWPNGAGHNWGCRTSPWFVTAMIWSSLVGDIQASAPQFLRHGWAARWRWFKIVRCSEETGPAKSAFGLWAT